MNLATANKPSGDRIRKTLLGQPVDRIAHWEHCINTRNFNAVLGKDTGVKSTLDWKTKMEDHIEFAKRTGLDSIGFGIHYCPGKTKWGHGWLKNRYDLGKMTPHEPAFDEWFKKLDRYAQALEGTDIGLWVYTHGPFDPVYLSMGLESFMMALYDDMEFIIELRDLCWRANCKALRRFCNYKLSHIMIGDDLAQKDSLLINPDMLRKLWFDRMKEMIAPAKEANIPIIFHSDGFVEPIIPWLVELGIQGVHPLEPAGGNDIYRIKKKYGDRITLVGNIDLSGVLSFGTPEQVREDVKGHIEGLAYNGKYICSSSNSIIDSVPPENYRAMLDAISTYGKRNDG